MLNRKLVVYATLVVLVCSGFLMIPVRAQEHLVTPDDLNQALQEKSQERRENLAKVRGFFESEQVRQTLEKTQLRAEEITEALPALTDTELERLAEQVRSVEEDVIAGALTNQQITYIIIALATAVIILVLVAA